MSRKNRFRNWLLTGFPVTGAGATSVKTSPAGGGGTKSRVLIVHLPPAWQVSQPAWTKSAWPAATSAGLRPPVALPPPAVSSVVVSRPLGDRTANCTHSLSASSAGTWVVLPGRVTVCWGRPPLAIG